MAWRVEWASEASFWDPPGLWTSVGEHNRSKGDYSELGESSSNGTMSIGTHVPSDMDVGLAMVEGSEHSTNRHGVGRVTMAIGAIVAAPGGVMVVAN